MSGCERQLIISRAMGLSVARITCVVQVRGTRQATSGLHRARRLVPGHRKSREGKKPTHGSPKRQSPLPPFPFPYPPPTSADGVHNASGNPVPPDGTLAGENPSPLWLGCYSHCCDCEPWNLKILVWVLQSVQFALFGGCTGLCLFFQKCLGFTWTPVPTPVFGTWEPPLDTSYC
jgi:hypothetical protein